MKKCPFCAEEIQEEAAKCIHCLEWLTPATVGSECQPASQVCFSRMPPEVQAAIITHFYTHWHHLELLRHAIAVIWSTLVFAFVTYAGSIDKSIIDPDFRPAVISLTLLSVLGCVVTCRINCVIKMCADSIASIYEQLGISELDVVMKLRRKLGGIRIRHAYLVLFGLGTIIGIILIALSIYVYGIGNLMGLLK